MKKHLLSIVLAMCMVFSLLPFGASAADQPKDPSLPLTPEVTYNQSMQSYGGHLTTYDSSMKMTEFRYTAYPVASNLIANADGTFTRVEALNDDTVLVEDYSADFELIWKHKIPEELNAYCGFYAGEDYNFLAFAQANPDEDDSVEVLRFVRYTKNWHRVDAVGVFGANTTEPCRAGSLRMVQIDDMLYVYTCHSMYADQNGTNHQASVYLSIHIPDMKLVNQDTDVGGGFSYISHCFNQFVLNDDGKLVLLGQGDAYPRAFVLTVMNDGYTPGTTMADCRKILEFGFSEEFHYHYNYTGASAGGLEASSENYLIAGTMIDQEMLHIETDPGNVVLHVVQKSQFDRTYYDGLSRYAPVETKTISLTNYADGDEVELETPHLVKLSSDHFLVLWVEHHGMESELHYMFLDGAGRLLADPVVREGALSDCRPVLSGNRVVWYVTKLSAPQFDSITVPEEFLKDTPKPSNPSNPFRDVAKGAFYYDPVLWAVNSDPQITKGVSDTAFAPGETCTRGQVVTFLWRAMGCPEPKSAVNPFADVKEGAFYYKAVLWAAENNITTGTSKTTFSPNEPCTRAHVVTFLWRTHEEPAAGKSNPFTDVKAGQYYTDAVLWAVSKGITNGTSKTTFAPGDPCTRGQIVTFLYRDLKKS